MRKALRYLENNSFFYDTFEVVTIEDAIQAIKFALIEQIDALDKKTPEHIKTFIQQQKQIYDLNTD